MKQKAVVVVSGGMDSTICMFHARDCGYEVYPLAFDYGQRNSFELECLRYFCAKYDFEHLKILDVSVFGEVGASELTSKKQSSVDTKDKKVLIDAFLPNRNALFITFAHSYCQKIGARTIFVGFTYMGYHDAKPAFLSSITQALNKGGNKKISIEAPFQKDRKSVLFFIAKQYGILEDIINHTYGCYRGDMTKNEWGIGCGICRTCLDRGVNYLMYKQLYEKT